MPHTATRPVRYHRFDSSLATNIRGVRGYEAYCACGAEFTVRKTAGEAQRDAENHRWYHRWLAGET